MQAASQFNLTTFMGGTSRVVYCVLLCRSTQQRVTLILKGDRLINEEAAVLFSLIENKSVTHIPTLPSYSPEDVQPLIVPSLPWQDYRPTL